VELLVSWMSKGEEVKESKHLHAPHVYKSGFFSSIRRNPWMPATVVLAIALIVLLFMGNGFGRSMSGDAVADKAIDYINAQLAGKATVTLDSIKEKSGVYEITVNYQGQKVPVYATKDGNFLVDGLTPFSASAGTGSTPQPAAELPKSDKPKVELFIMSYCPYGTQMEKAILPVVSALKDKIDFKLRYTHFTLHGEKEDTENFRQLCIREEQSTKFLAYIQCTLNSTDSYNPANQTQCMKTLGINVANVDSCIKGKAKNYFAVDSGLSEGYGVQGSPTLVVNGVKADTSRSPDAILKTICSAFNSAPSECSTVLSTDQASPGFGYSASSGADSAAIQCGF